jgi:hypothetical protein
MKRLLLIALFASTSCMAQEVGRLFFTPEQRAALDARRKARVPDKPAASVVASPITRVDGFVTRSSGPSTVWVNGEPLPEGAADAPRIGPRVSVPVGEGGRRATLRPGEALDRGTGEVRDVIGDGEIRIRRAP